MTCGVMVEASNSFRLHPTSILDSTLICCGWAYGCTITLTYLWLWGPNLKKWGAEVKGIMSEGKGCKKGGITMVRIAARSAGAGQWCNGSGALKMPAKEAARGGGGRGDNCSGSLGMVHTWVGQKLVKSNILQVFYGDWYHFCDATFSSYIA